MSTLPSIAPSPAFADPLLDEHEPWWRTRRADLLALADQGTARYVYHLPTASAAARRLRALAPVERVLYAVKANPHPDLLRLFHAEGLGFECVSPGEVRHVLRVLPDLDPAAILFTPNFAPRSEYAWAYDVGVRVTLDNAYGLVHWPEVFAGRNLIVRVDPGEGYGHHEHVRTAGKASKFGIAPEDLPEVADRVRELGARVIGLHAHVGSGIAETHVWAETAAALARYAPLFPHVTAFDLGGGLPVPDDPGAARFDVEAAAAHLATFQQDHPRFGLWLEPGRYLAAEAGVLLARVTQLKAKGDAVYVGVDAGMHTLIRPALYGARHEIVNLTRLDAPATTTAEVVGPICESGDVLGRARQLPDTREGDVLLIANAGAYGQAMASRYNLREPAAESVLG
ncbi:MAG: hypothetical protein AAF624_11565 [Bacteroidota bacterium]